MLPKVLFLLCRRLHWVWEKENVKAPCTTDLNKFPVQDRTKHATYCNKRDVNCVSTANESVRATTPLLPILLSLRMSFSCQLLALNHKHKKKQIDSDLMGSDPKFSISNFNREVSTAAMDVHPCSPSLFELQHAFSEVWGLKIAQYQKLQVFDNYCSELAINTYIITLIVIRYRLFSKMYIPTLGFRDSEFNIEK